MGPLRSMRRFLRRHFLPDEFQRFRVDIGLKEKTSHVDRFIESADPLLDEWNECFDRGWISVDLCLSEKWEQLFSELVR